MNYSFLIKIILESLYFALPMYMANMAPIIFMNVPFLKFLFIPIDRGKTWMKKRILGDHKTLLGFLSGVLMAEVTVYFQRLITLYYLDSFLAELSIFNYGKNSYLLFGFLMGFGALLGDSVKSFFKRQVGIKAGESWVPWDQLDFLIGALILTLPFFEIDIGWYHVLFLFLANPILQIIFSIFGFILNLKRVWW